MYLTSSEFKTAVANNAPQLALLLFADDVFDNSDIVMDKGIELHDYFTTEEDIRIGQPISNEFTFSLFNDNYLLNEYEFGEFKALLGVLTSDTQYTADDNCHVVVGVNRYQGFDAVPYLKKNGSSVIPQPSFPVKSMIVYNGFLYCFGANGQCHRQKESDNTGGTTLTITDHMKYKAMYEWVGKGMYLNGNNLLVYHGNRRRKYEFVPLGVFTANRPNISDDVEVDFECNDRMSLLDKEMSTMTISYPITLKNLLLAICSEANIPCNVTTFINSTATLDAKPDDFDNCTMRDVVGWIAEASCSNAKINRDGEMVLTWLSNTDRVLDEGNYSEFRPYWYAVPTVDKVYCRDTSKGQDITKGTGNNGYLIQDNPLMKGVTT